MLDARQRELADIQLKEEDRKVKANQLERLSAKTRSQLVVAFESADAVPNSDNLRDEFGRMRDSVLMRNKDLVAELGKLRHEATTKAAAKKDLKKAMQEKQRAIEEFDEQVSEAVGNGIGGGDSQEGNSKQTLELALEEVKVEILKAREKLSRKEAKKFTNEARSSIDR